MLQSCNVRATICSAYWADKARQQVAAHTSQCCLSNSSRVGLRVCQLLKEWLHKDYSFAGQAVEALSEQNYNFDIINNLVSVPSSLSIHAGIIPRRLQFAMNKASRFLRFAKQFGSVALPKSFPPVYSPRDSSFKLTSLPNRIEGVKYYWKQNRKLLFKYQVS